SSAPTLRLYNPETCEWSISLLDLDEGLLPMPPVVGEFNGNRGEFYDQEQYKGRAILVRYVWLNISPKSARMEQSFSADGGKTWETNWTCELTSYSYDKAKYRMSIMWIVIRHCSRCAAKTELCVTMISFEALVSFDSKVFTAYPQIIK